MFKRIALFSCLSLVVFLLQAQSSKRSIVSITSNSPLGEDSGTGWIVGTQGNQVFIATALHVVYKEDYPAEDPIIKFKDAITQEFPGEIFKYDESLDLAILTVEVPSSLLYTIQAFTRAEEEDIRKGEKVTVIGHPRGAEWTTVEGNQILQPSYSVGTFSIYNAQIVPGFSGAPVFSQSGKKLLGMLINVNEQSAEVVKLSEINRELSRWSIPTTNLLAPKIHPDQISWYLAGGALAGITASIILESEAQRLKRTYDENKIEDCEDFNIRDCVFEDQDGQESDRESTLEKANNRGTLAIITATSAVAMGVTSWLLYRNKVKKKRLQLSPTFSLNQNLSPNLGFYLSCKF
ncbi:MAG: serine protease [Bacteroidota bacterium]